MKNTIKINRRTVMIEANALVKDGTMPRGQAVRQGYKLARLYAMFAAGALATITFIKADGTHRTAQALPARTGEDLVKGTGRQHPRTNVLYWDCGKQDFRAFRKERLLTVA